MIGWLYLAVAIGAEIAATVALRASNGFTNLVPSAIVVAGYALAFGMLAQALKTVDLGLAYAVWAGIGTAAVAVIGIMAFGEPTTLAKGAGIVLIIAGVALLNLQGGHA